MDNRPFDFARALAELAGGNPIYREADPSRVIFPEDAALIFPPALKCSAWSPTGADHIAKDWRIHPDGNRVVLALDSGGNAK